MDRLKLTGPLPVFLAFTVPALVTVGLWFNGAVGARVSDTEALLKSGVATVHHIWTKWMKKPPLRYAKIEEQTLESVHGTWIGMVVEEGERIELSVVLSTDGKWSSEVFRPDMKDGHWYLGDGMILLYESKLSANADLASALFRKDGKLRLLFADGEKGYVELKKAPTNSILKTAVDPRCEDLVPAKARIVPELDSPFFSKVVRSYRWHIVDLGDGRLEDALDGKVDEKDRIQIEHTAQCVSSHQGKHEMNFCEAWIDRSTGTARLEFSGGLPAYASSLAVTIDGERNVTCSFEAAYPGPWKGLGWRITKKDVRLREHPGAAGERLYGWLSVEFEESAEVEGEIVWRPHRIEGYFKPVVREVSAGEKKKSPFR